MLQFGVNFTFDDATSKKAMEKALENLQSVVDSKKIRIDFETSGKANKDFGVVSEKLVEINKRIDELKHQWNSLTDEQRFANKEATKYSDTANNIVARYTELIEQSKTYGKSLREVAAEAKKAADAEERAAARVAAAKEKAAAKEEAQRQKAAAKKEAQARKQEQETERELKILEAQENKISAISDKLKLYQSEIKSLEIGSKSWNEDALQIRRLTEELQQATQQMKDFQQAAFKGIGDDMTTQQVAKLTKYREQLKEIEAQFNRLNQTGAAFTDKGDLTADANKVLKQREDIVKRINQMLLTAGQAQLQRERDINKAVEERRKKEAEIAAKQKAEQAALQKKIDAHKKIRQTLQAEENTISNITAKLQLQQQRLQSTQVGTGKFNRIAKEVQRLNTALEDANMRLREMTGETENLNGAFKKQETYVTRLVKRLGVYYAFRQVAGFLKNIRDTTAEFELQEVALGAVIRDADKAHGLFKKIQATAVKSPYEIKELVDYTKQLAAYGIEADSLFDTTKRLADISAGLGADMSRIILAYGQISAATVLKGTELRQITELGIPMVDLLAKKLTLLRGELVTTGQVFEMISQKAISFGMVKEIFDDLTDAGGMFYNMQEKQAETLAGQWSNLKDSLSIMYNEMGNVGFIHDIMESIIASVKTLSDNWRSLGNYILVFGTTFAVLKTPIRMFSTLTKNTKMLAKATQMANAAQAQLNATQGKGMGGFLARQSMAAAQAMRAAATATSGWTRALKSLQAAFYSNWITAAIAAISALVGWLVSATMESRHLKKELDRIGAEGTSQTEASVRNFKRLADAIRDSADGSKKQTEALKELQRTYGDIIPVQDLTVEKLRQQKDGYDSLTSAIREKIAAQTLENKLNAVITDYSGDIEKYTDKFKKKLVNSADLSKEESERIVAAWTRHIEEGGEASIVALKKIFSENLDKSIAEDAFRKYMFGRGSKVDISDDNLRKYAFGSGNMKDLIKTIQDYKKEIDDVTKSMEAQKGLLGKYTDLWKQAGEEIREAIKDITIPEGTEAFEAEEFAVRFKGIRGALEKVLKEEFGEGFDIAQYIVGDGIDFEKLLKIDKLSGQAKNVIKDAKNELQKLEGWKKTFWESAVDVGEGGEKRAVRVYFSKEEIDNLGNLNAALEDAAKKYKEYDAALKQNEKTLQSTSLDETERKEAEQLKQTNEIRMQATYGLLKHFNALNLIEEKQKKSASEKDPWIQLMKDRINVMKDFQDGVESLSTKLRESEAIATERNIMSERALSVGIDITAKKGSAEELVQYYQEAIDEVTKRIKEIGGEAYIDLDVKKILSTDMKGKLEHEYQQLLQWIFNQKTDFELKNIENNLKKELDRISKDIAKSREAKDFYDRLLAQTGNIDIASSITMTFYGDTGEGVFDAMVQQLQTAFGKDIDISLGIDFENRTIDYGKLRDILVDSDLPEERRKIVEKMISDEQEAQAKLWAQWEQTLAKAKDFEERRTEIQQKGDEDRKRMAKMTDVEPEQRERLMQASREEEAKETAKIDMEEFKQSEDYIKIFQDLDDVSTKTLDRLREKLQKIIDTNRHLSPSELKTYTDALQKLEDTAQGRLSGMALMTQAFEEYTQAVKDRKDAEAELEQEKEQYKSEKPQLEEEVITAKEDKEGVDLSLEAAKAEQLEIEKQIEEVQAQEVVDEQALAFLMEREAAAKQFVTAELLKQESANQRLAKAEENLKKAADKVAASQKKATDASDKMKKSTNKFSESLQKANETVSNVRNVLSGVRDLLGKAAEDGTELGAVFDGADEGLQMMQTMFSVILAILPLLTVQTEVWNTTLRSNPIFLILSAIAAALSLIMMGIKAAANVKVAKAEKEIKKIKGEVEKLEYTYKRLQKAADHLFGSDYIQNFNQQMDNLEARAEAQRKLAEAEQSKGKKASEDKVKDYLEEERELLDEIEDRKHDLEEYFAGTDLASAAEDFANAWIDAYLSFSDTVEAMKEKFADMMKNMIVKAAAAAIVQANLQKFYDKLETYIKSDDELTADEIVELANMIPNILEGADKGLTLFMEHLKEKGLDLQEAFGDGENELTGIAREIAGASEESINGLAAGINTQNYYMSHVPKIAADVSAMRLNMEASTGFRLPDTNNNDGSKQKTAQASEDGQTGWTDWQKQAMTNISGIRQNTAEILTECRKSAAQCEAIASDLHRVIAPKGSTTTHGISVYIR